MRIEMHFVLPSDQRVIINILGLGGDLQATKARTMVSNYEPDGTQQAQQL